MQVDHCELWQQKFQNSDLEFQIPNHMTNGSLFWTIAIASLGGAIVFVGLLMEQLAEKTWYSHANAFRLWKRVNFIGEWLVIIGVGIEVYIGCKTAVDEWKNNPLKQPVSQVSAVFLIEVSANNYNPKAPQKPNYLESASLGLGAFSLSAKEARWFEHIDNFATHHVGSYGIAVRFEQNILPDWEWNDINSTNPDISMPPNVTVMDAMSNL